MRRWHAARNVETLCIEPGSPWENGYVESFNGQLRDELLDREIFYTLTEAKILLERWRREDNTVAAAPCVGLSTAGSDSGSYRSLGGDPPTHRGSFNRLRPWLARTVQVRA